MKGGNLDNVVAPGIGMRFEKVIKTEEGKLDRAAKGYLLYLMGATDVNVYVVTTENSRKAAAFCLKWGVPYNKIVEAASDLEIPDICREMNLLTYFDLDKNVLQNINARGHGKIKAELWTSQED